MEKLTSQSLFDSLQQISDPRVERTKRHLLVDILVIAICGSICGAESWEEIAEFGRAKQEWFSRFLELPNGIASHDTFRRVFLLLKAEEFERTFLEWVRVAVKLSKGAVVNIDGKELRGTHSRGRTEGLRIVSAWAAEQAVVLGQVRTEEKSNHRHSRVIGSVGVVGSDCGRLTRWVVKRRLPRRFRSRKPIMCCR
jgi:hypothetical protein